MEKEAEENSRKFKDFTTLMNQKMEEVADLSNGLDLMKLDSDYRHSVEKLAAIERVKLSKP